MTRQKLKCLLDSNSRVIYSLVSSLKLYLKLKWVTVSLFYFQNIANFTKTKANIQTINYSTNIEIHYCSYFLFPLIPSKSSIKEIKSNLSGLCWDKCITNLLHNSQIKCDFRKFSWYDKFCFELGRWKNQCNMLKIVKTENLVKKSDGETLSELCQTSLD